MRSFDTAVAGGHNPDEETVVGKLTKLHALPEIEDVPLPDKTRTKDFLAKYNHLLKFNVGQSIPVNARTEWAYTVQEIHKETERKFRFVNTTDGLRLKREA